LLIMAAAWTVPVVAFRTLDSRLAFLSGKANSTPDPVAAAGIRVAAYGGGLGNRLGLAEIAMLAIVAWALTVLLAQVMSRRGYRGPAEVFLRRLTYGAPVTASRR
jgi:uncharacterized protein DUF418